MLQHMTTTRLKIAGAALAVLLLTGCAPTPPSSSPTPTATKEAAMPADSITTIDDGIAWARAIDKTITATELSHGINKIGDLVPTLDIGFRANNKIGQELIKLNAEVLNNPDTAGSKVDDLGDVITELQTAIAKGDVP